MLENIIKDRDFALLMQRNIQDLMLHFFSKNQHFGILCDLEHVSFEPELPQDIKNEFRAMTLFFLAGYTFETAKIENDYVIFEAGFGPDNIGSVVSVPLLSILQIIVEETPVLINLASPFPKEPLFQEQSIDEKGVEHSISSFLSNPENAAFLNKDN